MANRQTDTGIFTIGRSERISHQLKAGGDKPMLIYTRGLCGNESVILQYITGDGVCVEKVGSKIDVGGGRFFANKDQSFIVTPWPGIFTLYYSGKRTVEITTKLLPYPYDFSMMTPLVPSETITVS